jgi:asparagine synthase (glutamine-hydrolysing)
MSSIFGVWRRDASAPAKFCGPIMSRMADVQVAFDGRLDNRAELLDRLGPCAGISELSSDADLVGVLYAQRRDAFIEHLLGDFAVAVHDARARRICLARDAIGIRPLYYAVTPRRIIFASSVQQLLDDPETHARPNERLLASLMLQQLHRQDDDGATFFDGISSIPASHVVVCDVDRCETSQYWEFAARDRFHSMSFEDYAAELRSHLVGAVRRRLRSTSAVAISVSGGLDSSALFCLAQQPARDSRRVLGFTYTARDGSPADEHAFIEELEQLHGRIERIDTPDVGAVLDGARESIRVGEAPMLDLQRNRNDIFMSAMARSGARVVITGHWGDQVLFDQAYLVDDLRHFSWATVGSHLNEYRRWFPETDGGAFTWRLLNDVLDHASPRWVRTVARRIRRVWRQPEWWQRMYTARLTKAAGEEGFRRHPRNGRQITPLCNALYREVRSKFHALCLETNSKQSAQHGLVMAFPFLDRDLLAFLLGVPGRALVRGGVPKALLREAMRGVLPESIRTRRTKGDFTAIVARATHREFANILQLLSDKALVVQFGYVDVDTMSAGLKLAEQELTQTQSCMAAWRLTDIVALELWLQEFFGSRRHVKDVKNG